MKNEFRAFTLMELIIVVTVLIIIWAIWFMSFDWYLKDSRNTTRNVDLNTIKNWIELYHQKNLSYPTPKSHINVSYMWNLVWRQWYFPNDLDWFDETNHLFLDPTTWSWYSYSLLSSWKEFEVAAALEPVQFISGENKAYASSDPFLLWKALVLWNYNWKLLKTRSWSEDHIIACPSITSSINNPNLLLIIQDKKLVYDSYHNMPFIYAWSDFIVEWWFDFTPNSIVVYSWSLDTIRNDQLQRNILYKNFQLAYEWTTLSKTKRFINIVSTSNVIDPFNLVDNQKELVNSLVEDTLKLRTYKKRN